MHAALLLLLFLVPSSSSSAADRWGQWRGPHRDGLVGGAAWPGSISDGALRPLWRVDDLGDGYSGPVVDDRFVCVTETRDGELEVVSAYARGTGERAWTTEWEGALSVPFFAARNGSWIRATPALDDDRLYVAGMRDVLVCLDASSGDELWRVDFVERFGTPLPAFGFVSSPLVDGDHVYAQAGASFVKLDKRSGETVWRSLVDAGGMMGSAFSSPVLATFSSGRQLVVQGREVLAGVDPATGDVAWSRPIPSFRGMNILSPTIVGDAVFTATYGGRSRLLRIGEVQGRPGAVEEAWEVRSQGNMTSPVVIDGHAYFLNRSNRFTCIDLEAGEVAWISGPTGDDYWSLVAQGDRILALANTGVLRLLKANPAAYEEIDEAVISEDDTWAHLCVDGGDLFVREQWGLAAFRWSDPEAAAGGG